LGAIFEQRQDLRGDGTEALLSPLLHRAELRFCEAHLGDFQVSYVPKTPQATARISHEY